MFKWLFGKNKCVVKRTTKLVYDEQPTKYEVGKAIVNIKFVSGLELNKTIYGDVEQYKTLGNDEYISNSYGRIEKKEEPRVYDVNIYKAKYQAESFIKDVNKENVTTIVDDDKTPTVSISGNVERAEIIKLELHEVELKLAKIVPIEGEEK